MKNKQVVKIETNLTADKFDLFLSRLGDSILDLTNHNLKKNILNNQGVTLKSVVDIHPIAFDNYSLDKRL